MIPKIPLRSLSVKLQDARQGMRKPVRFLVFRSNIAGILSATSSIQGISRHEKARTKVPERFPSKAVAIILNLHQASWAVYSDIYVDLAKCGKS